MFLCPYVIPLRMERVRLVPGFLNVYVRTLKCLRVSSDRLFPYQYNVGPIPIAPATVLAPMAGVTDTVFRRLIRAQGGCGLIMTEFTSSHGIVAQSKATKPTRTFKYLYFQKDEHPISAQLFGSDPQVMADAAKYC